MAQQTQAGHAFLQVGHAFLWEYSYKRLKLAQLLGQLGVLLTLASCCWPVEVAMDSMSVMSLPRSASEKGRKFRLAAGRVCH